MQITKLLFLAPYPFEEPVTRFRMAQYIPYLKSRGIEVTVSSFMSSYFYKIKNNNGVYTYFLKACLLIWSCFKRLSVLFMLDKYDLVYISKEAFPFGPPFLEKIIASKKKVIFDFDDAIYVTSAIGAWRKIWIDKNRIAKILRLASYVIPGNINLAKYASRFIEEKKIRVLSTPIDTDRYVPLNKAADGRRVVIGWIGTWANTRYLTNIAEVFQELREKNDFVLKIVGPRNIYDIKIPNVDVEYKLWNVNEESSDIASFDIGIMPLDDTEWERGKCGFKIIQYMSVGIPAVASPVGVNQKILEDGKAGFLAVNKKDWIDKLSLLIADRSLRQKMGLCARKRAIERYSIYSNGPVLASIIKDQLNE